MSATLQLSDRVIFAETDLTPEQAAAMTSEALRGAHGGELYLQNSVTHGIQMMDSKVRRASSSSTQGFGLRAYRDGNFTFFHSPDLTRAKLGQAASIVRQIGHGSIDGSPLIAMPATALENPLLYRTDNPIGEKSQAEKIRLLEEIDAYVRNADSRVIQVILSLASSWDVVQIICADGRRVEDIRPMSTLSLNVIMKEGERTEKGGDVFSMRAGCSILFNTWAWKGIADKALHIAKTNMQAIPAPAGEMDVILGAGNPAVMLHEAVGHGLEGDFNRKAISAFSGKIGQQVAARGVTVIDQGNIPEARGSQNYDDEGTPTRPTVLIEDGVLVGYMQDTMNARLMGMAATGNGRRESFRQIPMPRMTTTTMASGSCAPEEIIASTKRGIFACAFAGGTVEITSGNYNFAASEAYLIENGKITVPVKGANLIGNGPKDMMKIVMIGNDSRLSPSGGTCGKSGQHVPVGLGQPTLKMKGLTVGGMG